MYGNMHGKDIQQPMPYLYLLQAIYEAFDRGNTAARIFVTEFSKGFDLIDHNILLRKLKTLDVSPVLVGWIAAFLTTRVKTHKLLQVCKQVVTILFTGCQQVVFALLVPSLL